MAAIVLVRGASFLTCPKSSMGINVVPGISMMRLLFKSSHNVVEGLIGSLQMFLFIIFLWCSIWSVCILLILGWWLGAFQCSSSNFTCSSIVICCTYALRRRRCDVTSKKCCTRSPWTASVLLQLTFLSSNESYQKKVQHSLSSSLTLLP